MHYNPTKRFAVLDAWRGVCALSVAGTHFIEAVQIRVPVFVPNSWVLVDFFFVLSGFVIVHAYGGKVSDAPSALTFLVRRFGRLWPLHVFTLAVLILIEFARLAAFHSGIRVYSAPFTGSA